MGGVGSGRKGTRSSTEDMHPLDIRKINRAGLLTPGRSFAWQWTRGGQVTASIGLRAELGRVVFEYSNRSRNSAQAGRELMNYSVRLDQTPCTLGSQRVWWLCPGAGCGRRVAILFGGRKFACRHCHALAYSCQTESADDRAARRADTIRRRLGWEQGIFNPDGSKPKGMHWRTFERLKREHDAFVTAACTGMSAVLSKRMEKLTRQLDYWRAKRDCVR